MSYDDPESFVEELFAEIDHGMRYGMESVHELIEGQLHAAAVRLLHSLLPPMVRASGAMVKASGSVTIGATSAAVDLALSAADAGNEVLAGAVANKVEEGLQRLRADKDYLRGVNSIAC